MGGRGTAMTASDDDASLTLDHGFRAMSTNKKSPLPGQPVPGRIRASWGDFPVGVVQAEGTPLLAAGGGFPPPSLLLYLPGIIWRMEAS